MRGPDTDKAAGLVFDLHSEGFLTQGSLLLEADAGEQTIRQASSSRAW